MPDRPVCPMCKEFGIHRNEQDCLDEMRAEVVRLRQQMRPWVIEASVTATGRFYPSYYDY